MRRSSALIPRSILCVAAFAGAGCQNNDFYNIAGYQQENFSNQVDILFVIDNSSSMADEATALALNFDSFISQLTSTEGTPATDDLSDAVDNFTTYVNDRGRVLDYQLALTTTTVDYSTTGATSGDDPGEAGRLIDVPISKASASVADSFTFDLLCEATCWSQSALEDDPSYACGQDPGGVISEQYLDCLCGAGEWEDHCGAGTEEHLEGSLDALCRSVETPPELCTDTISPLSDLDFVGTNAGFLREDSTLVVVIITDEGDTSRRLENGSEDPTTYLEAFEEFDLPIKVAVIGPDYDVEENSFPCNSGGATTWGAERLLITSEETSGFYNPIEESGGAECEVSDFSVHLNDLGQLLNTLTNVFQLQSIPDTDTIRVYVDGVEIYAAASTTDDAGDTTYQKGWYYDPSQNAVVFTDDVVPDYNQDVRIYYLPLEGKPRELPF